jgi:hypothetical protein
MDIELTSKDWFVLPENQAYSAKDWLTFAEQKISLKVGESRNLKFFVDVPKKAQGELVGMLSHNIQTETSGNIQKVLSVAIYAAVAGTEKMKATLKGIMISPSTGTLAVGVLIQNDGNVHIRPVGRLQIQNEKGQVVANIELPKEKPIYPGKEAVSSGQVSLFKLDAGRYKAWVRITDVDRKIDVIDETKKFELLENNSIDIK